MNDSQRSVRHPTDPSNDLADQVSWPVRVSGELVACRIYRDGELPVDWRQTVQVRQGGTDLGPDIGILTRRPPVSPSCHRKPQPFVVTARAPDRDGWLGRQIRSVPGHVRLHQFSPDHGGMRICVDLDGEFAFGGEDMGDRPRGNCLVPRDDLNSGQWPLTLDNIQARGERDLSSPNKT